MSNATDLPLEAFNGMASHLVRDDLFVVRHDADARFLFDVFEVRSVAAVLDCLANMPREQLQGPPVEMKGDDLDEGAYYESQPVALTIRRGPSLVGTLTEDDKGRLVLADLERGKVRRVA